MSTNMSAPSGSGGSSDELDAESENFDSLLALYSEGSAPLCSNVRVYDNVQQYENYIKAAQQGTLRQRIQHTGRGKRSAAAVEAAAAPADAALSAAAVGGARPSTGDAGPSSGTAAMTGVRGRAPGDPAANTGPPGQEDSERFIIPGRRFTESQAPVAVQKRQQKTVLTRMAAAMPGPCGRLKWCMDHRAKVKVYTRNYGRVRGVCAGYIVAFDKHWNLCLEDVDEIYQKKVRRKSVFLGDPARVAFSGDRPAGDAATSGRSGHRARSEVTDLRLRAASAGRSGRPGSARSGRGRSSGPPSGRAVLEEDPEVARLTARMALLEPPRSRRSQRRPVFETARRHIRQLFVRGDNVVLVALEEAECTDLTENTPADTG